MYVVHCHYVNILFIKRNSVSLLVLVPELLFIVGTLSEFRWLFSAVNELDSSDLLPAGAEEDNIYSINWMCHCMHLYLL